MLSSIVDIRWSLLFGLAAIAFLRLARGDEVFVNSANMRFRRIDAGRFEMGSPRAEAQHRDDEVKRTVVISRSFYLATTEVTQAQWKMVMGTEPWSGRPYVREGAGHAATYITWDDANLFCRKLVERENRTYRLPTEAEWEYACRAGTTTVFSFGNDEAKLPNHAWIGSNTFDAGRRFAHEVAKKKPNPWGLYDMHGNNWEWCSDWYSVPVANETRDPVGPPAGEKRVIRGGSWHCLPALCRSASRFKRLPGAQLNDLGFRVVCEAKER